MVMDDHPDGAAIGAEQAGAARKLVVCCVDVDAAQLQPAFDVLAMRGFEIEVIEREDVLPAVLAEHAQRQGDDAFFVLARIVDAAESDVAPLAEALHAAEVAADRISTLAIDWRDPMALVEHVVTVAGAARSSDAPILRTTTTSPAAGRRESTGPQRTIALVAPRTETGPQRNVVPPRTTTESTAKRRTLGVKVAVPVEDAVEPNAEQVTAPRPVAPPIEPAAVPVPAVEAVTGIYEPVTAIYQPVPVQPERVAPAIAPVAAAPAPRVAVTATTAEHIELDTDANAALRAPGSRTRILVGAGLAVALVGSVVFFAGRDRTNASASTQAPATATVVDAPVQSVSTAAAPESSTAAKDVSALVEQARERKELGIHEGIVFAPVHAPQRKFDAAKQQCDDMNSGALQGWRMPTLAEIHVLSVAGVIDRGAYWSGTEGDAFGSQALIWSEKKSAALPITKAWSGARALCVRDDGRGP